MKKAGAGGAGVGGKAEQRNKDWKTATERSNVRLTGVRHIHLHKSAHMLGHPDHWDAVTGFVHSDANRPEVSLRTTACLGEHGVTGGVLPQCAPLAPVSNCQNTTRLITSIISKWVDGRDACVLQEANHRRQIF